MTLMLAIQFGMYPPTMSLTPKLVMVSSTTDLV